MHDYKATLTQVTPGNPPPPLPPEDQPEDPPERVYLELEHVASETQVTKPEPRPDARPRRVLLCIVAP